MGAWSHVSHAHTCTHKTTATHIRALRHSTWLWRTTSRGRLNGVIAASTRAYVRQRFAIDWTSFDNKLTKCCDSICLTCWLEHIFTDELELKSSVWIIIPISNYQCVLWSVRWPRYPSSFFPPFFLWCWGKRKQLSYCNCRLGPEKKLCTYSLLGQQNAQSNAHPLKIIP